MAAKLFYSYTLHSLHQQMYQDDFTSCQQQSKQNDLSQDSRFLQGDMTALFPEPPGSAGVGLIGDNAFVF